MQPSIADIQAAVCEVYGVTKEQLLSGRRETRVARWVGIYLARKLTSKGFPIIAHHFHCDRTTAVLAVKRMDGDLQSLRRMKLVKDKLSMRAQRAPEFACYTAEVRI